MTFFFLFNGGHSFCFIGRLDGCMSGFHRFLPVFVLHWKVLPKVLPGFTWFYLVSPGFTWFYLVLPGFTWFYLVLPGFTWFYLVLPGFTRFYLVLPHIFLLY